MTDEDSNWHREVVRGAVAATRVRSPVTFSWFGQRSPDLPPAVTRAMTGETARAYLVHALRARLYQDMYTHGFAVATSLESETLPTGPGSPFVEELASANTGGGCWEPGWAVTSVNSEGIVLSRDGLRLIASVEDCRAAGESTVMAGVTVEARTSKEMRGISPGFYMALGNVPSVGPASGLVRYYWHLTPLGAVPLMAALTARLNHADIPFRLKVLNDPSAYVRCDAGVLYIDGIHLDSAHATVSAVARELQGFMRPSVPAFTKKLTAGLGLAEDPGNGASFGFHRCEMVAEGLVRADERGARTPTERLEVVLSTLEERGIDIDAPYLNPGSRDQYPVIADPPVPVQGLRQRTHGRTTPTSLDVAVRIGQQLCDLAILAGNECSWIGPVPEVDGSGKSRAGIHAPLGADLYNGTAGVGWFLGELHLLTGEPRFRSIALAALEHANTAYRRGSEKAAGLFTGRLGIALVAARLGEGLGNDRLLSMADDLTTISWPSSSELDLLSGTAGAILANLAIARLMDRPDLVETAVTQGDQLLSAARPGLQGCSWLTTDAPLYRDLTGYSHGAAGIAHALLELGRQTGDHRFLKCAEAAFAYERDCFSEEDQNWYDFRLPPRVRDRRAWLAGCVSFWCHGAPGIALSRLGAIDIVDDPRMSSEARIALMTTRHNVEAFLATGAGNYSLCHGLVGNAEILAQGAHVLDEADGLADVCYEVAERGADAHVGRGARPWPCGVAGVETPGLMLGLAGIGMFYLRRADSSVPSPILLASDPLATHRGTGLGWVPSVEASSQGGSGAR